MGKLKDRRGRVNRVIAVLLVLIAVMLVLIAIPAWQRFRYRSEKTACIQAMKSARDGLIIEYLSRWARWTRPCRRWTRCCPSGRTSVPQGERCISSGTRTAYSSRCAACMTTM